MFKSFKQWFKIRVNTIDDTVAEWYWRRKYNALLGQHELLKEVMRDDIYNRVVKEITESLELAGCKKTIRRLNTLLDATREERNEYYKRMKEAEGKLKDANKK